MVYVGAVAAIVALLFSLLNFLKGSGEWFTAIKQKRVERRMTAVELQVNAWKELVLAQEKRNDLLEKRITAAEGREQACEEERDHYFTRMQELAVRVKELEAR